MTCPQIHGNNCPQPPFDGTCGPAAKQGCAPDAKGDTTQALSEALSMLTSAVRSVDADPHRKMQALVAARANSACTYEALLQISETDLTTDMREVISLYQEAGEEIKQLQNAVDQTLGTYTSLFDAIMKIPAVNRNDQMMRFLEIFLKIAQQSRQTSTTLSVLGFRTQIEELKLAAEKIKQEGEKTYSAGILRGALSITSGAMVGGTGGFSAQKQLAAGRQTQRVDDLDAQKFAKQQEIADTRDRITTLEREGPVVPTAFELAVRRNELHTKSRELTAIQNNLNAAKSSSTAYSVSSNNWMTAGRAAEPVLSATGGMTGATFDLQASEDRSEQTQRQAAATAGEQNKTLAEKFSDSSQAVVASVLQTVRDVGLAEADAYKAAARA
jgi:hypothetical protein